MAGYSHTPLVRKLGLVPGMAAAVINPPMPYASLLAIDTAPPVLSAGDTIPYGLGYLHLFTTARAELGQVLSNARPRIARDGMI